MALNFKHGFVILLLAQLVILVSYLILKGIYVWPITFGNRTTYINGRLDLNETCQTLISINCLLLKIVGNNVGLNVEEELQTSAEDRPQSTETAGGKTLMTGQGLRLKEDVDRANERRPTNISKKLESFQPIDKQQAWLYSAFFDHVTAQTGRPLVRLFGVFRNDFLQNLFCLFTDEPGNFTSKGFARAFADHHRKRYVPAFVECQLPNQQRPTHISVSFQAKEKPTNGLQIIYPGPRIRNFTVCYSVLHSGFNIATQIIQSIEMNRILGAEHFMIYNYSISPTVDQILSRYQEDGLVTVLQWPLPNWESWSFAQMTALNDCFFRNRNVSRFVVVVDTDEFMLPKSSTTWMELIHSASSQEPDVSRFINASNTNNTGHKPTGCFMVRSSLFTINWKPTLDALGPQFVFTEDEKKNIIKYNMLVLSQVWRNILIFNPFVRSKYIARPELVQQSGIHYVHAFTTSTQCLAVSEGLALVHHHSSDKWRWGNQITGDSSALHYKGILYQNIMKQIKRFPNIFN